MRKDYSVTFTPLPVFSYQTSGSVEEEQDEAAVGTHHFGA